MKILNLYAGIGGNRKLWENVEVTAIEWDKQIASIYQDFFPDDEVVVTDAHQFLLENFEDYDFIWSSPPCPTHSKLRTLIQYQDPTNYVYPDMRLYQEIIFLSRWFLGLYCVENVMSYYNPLIKPQILDRHYFWANFIIRHERINKKHKIRRGGNKEREASLGFDLEKYSGIDKTKILRNCVYPEVGKIILDCARGNTQMPLSQFTNKGEDENDTVS